MPQRPHPRAARALRCAAASAAVLAAVAGCSAVAEPIPHGAPGWSSVHGQGYGGNAVAVDGPRSPEPEWTRDLTAPPTGSAASGPDGQLVVSARTDAGCQLFVFSLESGRKTWCSWQNLGPAGMSPLIDQWAAVYVGNIGSVDSFDYYGAPRWHTPVIGTPRPLQFLADRAVLAVTHVGQVNVLSSVSGRKLAPSVALAPQNWPPPPDEGLGDCADAGPGCPVAFAPAADADSGDFYFPFRAPGTDGAVVVAMRYSPGPHHGRDIHRNAPGEDADGAITELWRSQPLPGGAASSPTLSSDGSTVYVLDGEHALWALDAHDGTALWHIGLGFDTGDSISMTPDGLLVVGPAGTGPVAAVRDDGDGAVIAWARPRLAATGPVSVAANRIGYVVTRDDGPAARGHAANGSSLTTLDLADGRTISTTALAPRSGPRGRVVIAGDGRVVVLGSQGLVSVFG